MNENAVIFCIVLLPGTMTHLVFCYGMRRTLGRELGKEYIVVGRFINPLKRDIDRSRPIGHEAVFYMLRGCDTAAKLLSVLKENSILICASSEAGKCQQMKVL